MNGPETEPQTKTWPGRDRSGLERAGRTGKAGEGTEGRTPQKPVDGAHWLADNDDGNVVVVVDEYGMGIGYR